ncbi:hypothetical protein PgNI_11169 [Pyricularia grisea]|uniref:Uncharacterized protein n=1 Tax=Pyricularia grisea TaxID=148305 RepID=A0A6P8APT6_PYRGI|nr:hypothetical protein PgNI_11169 [Pyricularia grisea]TLD04042.1 hypothetical protein PgNI_11169 [Pyricularia grisea]
MVFRRNAAFFVAVALAATSASAMELTSSEVPAACQQICMPVVLLSGACATAERQVLGDHSSSGTAIPSSSTPSLPAAAPPSSPPPSSAPPSSAPPSSSPPSSSPPSSSPPPPPPPPSSSPSSSSPTSIPPSSVATTSPPPPVSSPSEPSPTTTPPATTQPPATTPPAATTAPPENSPSETTPPPQLTPTEGVTTPAPGRSRKGEDDGSSSSSSSRIKFGPAAESFLAALSIGKSEREHKAKQQGAGVPGNYPPLPTPVPGSSSVLKRDLKGRDGAVGRRQASSSGENSDHDQFQRACYCRNLSFDVSGISGLCGSCIDQNSKTDQERKGLADANGILSKCGFPTATYNSDSAKQAAGITLVAVMPSRVAANGTGGQVFVPGTMPKNEDASTTSPVPSTKSGSRDGQDSVQKGGVGEMATSGSLAVLTAVCWAILALVAV